MLTMNSLIQNNYPTFEPLTDNVKEELLQENESKNYSYYCLLKERLQQNNITVSDLLRPYCGIKLFTL